ncbi:SCO family protein [Sneathiella sp. CAU 1612]|jgi:cytochrome oxidase Cu insertion factor (SCO1/SenC/PrrC family)|uniref:SCO family protein n=1 Tax=Sneathiella sedimenti TaxID=2816034 RepID=A0ABS3F0N0_9PROT|nr:SCO family protein [Sneathiella sedimenti]MBO0332059.1 SCO family protein [Sneathiella sedimenti]
MNKIFAFCIAFFLLASAVVIGFWFTGNLPGIGQEKSEGSSVLVGVPQIGGPFSLVNHKGETVTDEDLEGKLFLVFFGFTNCPDVCPTEMQTISVAMQELGDDAKEVVPLFVTVDPARDTPEILASFVSAFHPAIVGLTGSEESINDMKKKYRVYSQKQDNDDPDYYLVDHTSFTYLMGRDGDLITVFSFGVPAEEMASKVREQL